VNLSQFMHPGMLMMH